MLVNIKYDDLVLWTCIAAILLLCSCAVSPDGHLAGAGSASYEYKRVSADGSSCSLVLLSGRDVVGGSIAVDQQCGVVSKADSTSGVESALQVIGASISAIREAVSKVP